VTPKATLLDQFRKPTGSLGRVVLQQMNSHHSELTDWGLAHISVGEHDTVLDIGCGGGRTVSKLAAIVTQGKVCGIDYSNASVAASRRTNAKQIDSGRVEIRQGSVSQLPFPDGVFDLVTAVETHFFWPNLPADLREVFRVLKPGGSFMIIAEVYKGGKMTEGSLAGQSFSFTNMTILSADEHRDLFTKTGFSDVQILEECDKGWLCCIGRKP
jgi:ubiquinone/menaquinone biosynthesis C-methylase UbiE